MEPFEKRSLHLNRRAFLSKGSIGVGVAALSSIFGVPLFSRGFDNSNNIDIGLNGALKNWLKCFVILQSGIHFQVTYCMNNKEGLRSVHATSIRFTRH